MFHIHVDIHNIHHIGLDLAEAEQLQQMDPVELSHSCQIPHLNSEGKELKYRKITCLFEGLRPHESRIFWPPNGVPFNIRSASSAQALVHHVCVEQNKGAQVRCIMMSTK